MPKQLPLFESDLNQEGLFQPQGLGSQPAAPRAAVLCYFQEAIENLAATSQVLTGLNSFYSHPPVYTHQRAGDYGAAYRPSGEHGAGAPPGGARFGDDDRASWAFGCQA